MSTRNFGGPFIGPPEYALAVSLIFTKATEQTIMLGTPPNHVCSTSILWNSLAHDKRFTQVAMSEAAPGDIIIEPGWKKAADGYAGIVVDHGRIVSNSSHGVQNDSSLIEIQRNRQDLAIFRYIGVQGYLSYPLANTGDNDDEPRLPAGQPGGGQWTSADRQEYIEGYKKGVKEAIPVVAPFIPVASQIQSIATLQDPTASKVDKAVALIGMIPEVGGIAKDAGAVVKGVVTAEEAAAKAKQAAQLLKNAETGAQRAAKTAEKLAAENPGKVVQQERTLRDAAGNKVLDPVTGEGRRVDHAVIDQEAGTAKAYETTGDSVDKRLQQKKEERIRDAGGTYIRDKETRKLIPVEGVSEVRRQK